jgi:miniconductance mechanosensitive channel
MVEKNVFKHLALIVPALVMQFFIPIVLSDYPKVASISARLINLFLVLGATLVIDALVNAMHAIYQRFKVSQEIPLTGFVQVVKLVLYLVAIVLFMAVLLNRTPIYLFSGLGAMTAVLMLIFKDPILGFVAGIQLISNRMLKLKFLL